MRIIIRRFIELLLVEIILSVIAVSLNVCGAITERQQIATVLFICTIIYLVLNVCQFRFCYEDLYGENQYYILNFIAVGLFLAVTFISYSFMPNAVYTWLFSLTKNMYYLGWDELLSILFFFGVLLLLIVLSPIGINWVVVDEEEDMQRLSKYGDNPHGYRITETDGDYDEGLEPGVLFDEDDDAE